MKGAFILEGIMVQMTPCIILNSTICMHICTDTHKHTHTNKHIYLHSHSENKDIWLGTIILVCVQPHSYISLVHNKTDILERKFLKYTLEVSFSCPSMAVYGETSETTLSLKGLRQMLNFWYRTNNLPKSRAVQRGGKVG